MFLSSFILSRETVTDFFTCPVSIYLFTFLWSISVRHYSPTFVDEETNGYGFLHGGQIGKH